MIKINNPRIEEIAQEYFEKINSHKILDNQFQNIFSFNLQELILCEPNRLCELNNNIMKNFQNIVFDDLMDYMEGLYKRRIELYGSWLSKELNVSVCPYCNLNFTHTIIEKKIRPEFDHFYPKSVYPLLSLSFYNLIPSCPVCNHTKKIVELQINPYIQDFSQNPFIIDDPLNSIFYGSKRKTDKEKWMIKFTKQEDIYAKNIEVFGLLDRYNELKDYAEEIVFKAITYGDGYYESLTNTFNKMELTKSEMDRIIFGNYVSPEDFHKRPLSKLTHDILEQFDVKF